MIKKLIKKLYYFVKKIKTKKELKKILKRDKEKAVFLIGSPLHGNIGDHAISIAERKILENVKEKSIIEIPGEYYNLCHEQIKDVVKKDDIILITGGGFIGSLWMNEENMVRHIVNNFKQNRIIIMPQTIFFEDNETGRKEFEISKSIYEAHPDLWVFVREEKSYNYCKENLGKIKNLFLVPDVVTYLDYQLPQENREGILLCLRNDKEKTLLGDEMTRLMNNFESMDLDVKETTTVIKERISLEDRQEIFEKKLLEFKKSKVLITDRLHGMIFAAITATPCVAMNNLSGKVKGVYKWLEDLEYIKFLDNTDNILEEIKELLNKTNNSYNANKLQSNFDKIIEVLNN